MGMGDGLQKWRGGKKERDIKYENVSGNVICAKNKESMGVQGMDNDVLKYTKA